MDIARQRRKKLPFAAAGGVLVVAALSFSMSRLGSAAPGVKKSGLWVDTVQRGELVREVRGPGTLVPEQIRFVSASWPARVKAVLVKAGEIVDADTVLLELENAELELQALEAERALASAAAALVELGTQGDSTQLQLDATLATLEFDAAEAARQAQSSKALSERGMVSTQEHERAAAKLAELQRRLELEKNRKAVLQRGLSSQKQASTEQLGRLRAVAEFRRRQVEGLKVRAGDRGVVQELLLQPGQWVGAGAVLAKVAQPERLKAEVRVSEVQARDVAVGQRVRIDTRQGIADGVVARIDPSVVQGSVKVDVSITSALPKGARPDLSIEGIVELERLPSVLHVGRPAFARAEGPTQLFRIVGTHAERVPVTLGKSSVTAVEVVNGLSEGDEVVLSDLSQFDSNERLDLQ